MFGPFYFILTLTGTSAFKIALSLPYDTLSDRTFRNLAKYLHFECFFLRRRRRPRLPFPSQSTRTPRQINLNNRHGTPSQ